MAFARPLRDAQCALARALSARRLCAVMASDFFAARTASTATCRRARRVLRGAERRRAGRSYRLGDDVRLAGSERSELHPHPLRTRPAYRARHEQRSGGTRAREDQLNPGAEEGRSGGLDEHAPQGEVSGYALEAVAAVRGGHFYDDLHRDAVPTSLLAALS